ncbi:TetR/AcrR family transcriptional regulator [bacterium]|nr:TetR/AcrR family transcriptional regulator [bacterium]
MVIKKDTYHHGNLKEALILSGVEILKESGYGALSLRLVAKNAGVSHTAPYSHFKSKEELYAAIAEYGFDLLSIKLNKTMSLDDSPMNILKIMIKDYIYFATDNPDIYSVMFAKDVDLIKFKSLHTKAIDSLNLLQSQLEICQLNSDINIENSEKQALFLWTSMHGFSEITINHKIPDNQRDCETKKVINYEEIVNSILDYLIKAITK